MQSYRNINKQQTWSHLGDKNELIFIIITRLEIEYNSALFIFFM